MLGTAENKYFLGRKSFFRGLNLQLFAILSVLLFALGACGGNDSQTDTASGKKDLLTQIKERGEIRIGLEGTYPPYSFHDEKGALTGIEKEIGENIAADLGVKAKFIETKWDSLIAGVDVGKYDIVINQVDPTQERKEKYDFTSQYTRSIGKIAVAKDAAIKSVADLKGLKAAQTSTSNWARKAEEYGMTILPTEGFATEIELVASGRADATVNDLVVFEQYFAAHPDAPVRLLDAEFTAGECCAVLLAKNQSELLTALNDAIESSIEAGEYGQISKKYLGIDITANSFAQK